MGRAATSRSVQEQLHAEHSKVSADFSTRNSVFMIFFSAVPTVKNFFGIILQSLLAQTTPSQMDTRISPKTSEKNFIRWVPNVVGCRSSRCWHPGKHTNIF